MGGLRAANSAQTWHPDPHEPRMHHFRTEEMPSNTDIPADGATSDTSWSPSIDYQRDRRPHDAIHEVPTSLHDREEVHMGVENSLDAAHTVHPRSSVSNVPRVRKQRSPSYHSPLDQVVATARAQQRSPKVYYSLDDLKSMAKGIGDAAHEPTHSEPLTRRSPPYQQPRSRYSIFTQQERHGALELMTPSEEIDARFTTRRFADTAVSEEQNSRESTMLNRDGGILKKHYGESRHPSPRFPHPAEAHRLVPTEPTLWTEPRHILPDSGSLYPESKAEADEQSNFEQLCDPEQRPYDLTYGRLAPPIRQPLTTQECVPLVRDGGLDGFDAELLQSIHEPNPDFDPHGRSLESLLSPPRQRSRPPTRYDGRELDNDHEDCQFQGRPRAATIESMSQLEVIKHEEHRRPQLLRPSKEQSLQLEPFTGFSRPCILY